MKVVFFSNEDEDELSTEITRFIKDISTPYEKAKIIDIKYQVILTPGPGLLWTAMVLWEFD